MSDRASEARDFNRAFVLVVALAASVLFFALIRGFAVALLLAAVFAALSRPLYRRVRARMPRRGGLAAVATVLLLVLLVFLPLFGLSVVLVKQGSDVAARAAPWLEERLGDPESAREWISGLPLGETLLENQEAIVSKSEEFATAAAGFVVNSLAKASRVTIGLLLQLFVLLYAMVYFLRDGRRVQNGLMDLLPLAPEAKARFAETFMSVARATVKGTFVIAIVQGTLLGAALAVAGVDSAVFWAFIGAILSIIPGIGPALVYVPASVVLMLDGHTGAGVGVLLWGAIVISSSDNLLRPVLVGRDTKMPDVLILVSTFGGLAMFGAAGIIIGPMVAAVFLTAWSVYDATFENVLGRDDYEDRADDPPAEVASEPVATPTRENGDAPAGEPAPDAPAE